jgi:hypothetical protein
VIEPLGAAQARWRARQGLDFQVHQARGRKGQHLTHEVGISTLLDQLDKRHSVVGHRRSPASGSVRNRTLTEDRR